MQSIRTKLSRSVNKFSTLEEIEDIILFGSIQRAKDSPRDIDVLVIFKNKVNKNIEQEIKNTIGIDVTRSTLVYGEDIDSQDWVKKANRALN